MSCLLRWRRGPAGAPDHAARAGCRSQRPFRRSVVAGSPPRSVARRCSRNGGGQTRNRRPPEEVGVRHRPPQLPGVDALRGVVALDPPPVVVPEREPLDGHRPVAATAARRRAGRPGAPAGAAPAPDEQDVAVRERREHRPAPDADQPQRGSPGRTETGRHQPPPPSRPAGTTPRPIKESGDQGTVTARSLDRRNSLIVTDSLDRRVEAYLRACSPPSPPAPPRRPAVRARGGRAARAGACPTAGRRVRRARRQPEPPRPVEPARRRPAGGAAADDPRLRRRRASTTTATRSSCTPSIGDPDWTRRRDARPEALPALGAAPGHVRRARSSSPGATSCPSRPALSLRGGGLPADGLADRLPDAVHPVRAAARATPCSCRAPAAASRPR